MSIKPQQNKTKRKRVWMMTSSNGNIFRVTGPLCGEFTGHRHKGQWRGVLMFSLICAWINGWINNREAGDLRRHCAHYDVIVMYILWDRIQKDSRIQKHLFDKENTCFLIISPRYFILWDQKPISYNIHWGKHCGHWTSIAQLHMEGQSMLHAINAFRIDIFATSGDPY